jgi:hypothetical protein
LEVPKCPKTAEKTYFLVALDHFFLKNGTNDMVRGLFSSFNIGIYRLTRPDMSTANMIYGH